MTKSPDLTIVAKAMEASGSLDYDSAAGISGVAWNDQKERILRTAKQIYGEPANSTPGYTEADVRAWVVFYASRGETPEALPAMFGEPKRFPGFKFFGTMPPISYVEKGSVIKSIVGEILPDAFAPLPAGTAQTMLQNVYGHWFTLARENYPLPLLLRHARAHHAAAEMMFKKRDSLYSFQGWNHDGLTTQTRPAALAKLEMKQIIGLGLSEGQLLNFFVWWTVTGEITSSRQLAEKYSNADTAATDALVVLERLINGVKPHNANSSVFEFKGVLLYFLQGVCVPSALVMTPAAQLDPRTVLTCPNPAIRKKLAEKITYARLLTTLGRIIDEIGEYQLWDLSFPDMDIRVLRIEARLEQDPSKAFWEGVKNSCGTVREALIFRNGTDKLPAWIT